MEIGRNRTTTWHFIGIIMEVLVGRVLMETLFDRKDRYAKKIEKKGKEMVQHLSH